MTERRVVVRVGELEAPLAGPAADLVALVAASDPGDLTLRLAAALIAHDRRLRSIAYGSVELHVNRRVVRIVVRESLGPLEVPA